MLITNASCSPNLAGQTSLKQLAALLTMVDAVLANDSGPMHLAAELGTPVVGIFTCTSPERSGPPGDRHEFVSTQLPCAASYHKLAALSMGAAFGMSPRIDGGACLGGIRAVGGAIADDVSQDATNSTAVQTILQDVHLDRARHEETDAAAS